jgi:hypothetical protein
VGPRASLNGWHLQEDLDTLRGEMYSRNMHFFGTVLCAVRLKSCGVCLRRNILYEVACVKNFTYCSKRCGCGKVEVLSVFERRIVGFLVA